MNDGTVGTLPVQRSTRNRMLALGIGLLAGCLLAELALRAFDFIRGKSTNARAFWYWLYEQDPYMGYRGRPHAKVDTGLDQIEHNEDGFRDGRSLRELHGINPKTLVICVGESSTYGLAAGRNENAYPAVLERELRDRSGDPTWIVYNAGVPGYSAAEVVSLLNLRLLKVAPRYVVSMDLRNDYMNLRRLSEELDYNHYLLRQAQWSRSLATDLLMKSSVVAFAATRWRLRFGDDLGGAIPAASEGPPTKAGLRFYRTSLEMMALVVSRAGASLLFVDQPIEYRLLKDSEPEGLEEYRAALTDFCRERGIPLLAAHTTLDRQGMTPQDDVHLGTVGYARLAAHLAPQILAIHAAGQAAGGESLTPR